MDKLSVRVAHIAGKDAMRVVYRSSGTLSAVLAVIIMLLILSPVVVQADMAGPFSPQSGSNNTSIGSRSWSDTSNVRSSDNRYAEAGDLSRKTISNYLVAQDFKFSIPSGATITGIKVDIERKERGKEYSGHIRDYRVMLVKNGSITGNNYANTSANWPSWDQVASYGSSTDLWGQSWAPSDINASNFGVALAVQGVANDDDDKEGASVDHMKITVYYSSGPACTASAPTVTITPLSQTITQNSGSVNYSVTIKNNDTGSACSNVTYPLTVSDTNTTAFNASTLSSLSVSLAAGATSSPITLTVDAKGGYATGTNTTTVKASASGHPTGSASVTTTINVGTCAANAPTVTITPTSQTITQNSGSVNYSVTIKNNDTGSACSTVTYPLTVSDTNTTAFNASTLTSSSVILAPGATSSPITLTVSAKSGQTTGTNTTTVTASASGHPTGSASVTTTINVGTCTANTPTLQIAPAARFVAPGGTATYTVTVTNNDTAVCSAVIFTVGVVSDSNPSDFNTPSTLTPISLSLTPGQSGTSSLTVSAKTTALNNAVNITVVWVTANGHTSPPNVSVTTTIGTVTPGASLLHNSVTTGSTKWAAQGGWGVLGGQYGEFVCDTCHTEDTTNIKRIKQQITVPSGTIPGSTVNFQRTSGPNSFGSEDTTGHTTSTKICEVCHTLTSVHKYNQPTYVAHETPLASDCVACHKHNKGFSASCTSCHGQPPLDAATLVSIDAGGPTGHTAGAHATHWSKYNTQGCVICHSGGGAADTGHTTAKIITMGFTYGLNQGVFSTTPFSNGFSAGSGAAGTTVNNNQAAISCTSIYCHSSGQSSTGGPAPTFSTVNWTTPGMNCGSCHQNMDSSASATGSHLQHAQGAINYSCATCHNGYAEASAAAATHVDNQINLGFTGLASGTTYSQGNTHAVGNGYGNCTTSACHGGTSPAWGANTTNNTCTKCHGTGTVTVTVANRYVVAPPKDTAGNSGTATGKGLVDTTANSQIGAHQTHLQYFNGLRSTAYDTNDDRCGYCHGTLPTSGGHANGSSTPVFQGLATKSGAITNASYAGVTCTNTYCHNPSHANGTLNTANTGTDTSPDWNNAAYLGDTLKTTANCSICHKSPWDAGFTSSFAHGAMTAATDCAGCHGHNGDGTGNVGQRHLDGIRYGGGDCIGCHSGTLPLSDPLNTDIGNNGVRPIVSEFSKQSHHVSGRTVTKFDCVVCHAEGDVADAAVNANHKNGQIDLRNVDNATATFVWTGTEYYNLNNHCLSCHDSNGASVVRNADPAVTTETAANPFGSSLTNTYDQQTRTAVVDVRTQFTASSTTYLWSTTANTTTLPSGFTGTNYNGNFSQHAVLGPRYATNVITSTKWTSATLQGGQTPRDNVRLFCGDCHTLGDPNIGAHGSNNEYMLKNSSGTDAEYTGGTDDNCFICHASGSYNKTTSNHGPGNGSDYVYSNTLTGAARGTGEGTLTGYACLNCHSGGTSGWGGIHGATGSYTNGAGTSTNKYRFFPGFGNRGYMPGASANDWAGSTDATCYTPGGAVGGTTWGNCAKHTGGETRSNRNPRATTY